MKYWLTALLILTGNTVQAEHLFLEAEQFENEGGWKIDPQFMDQMGSPYLLAHGLGEPVADAVTKVTFPIKGTYRVWVRTKDWVAPWGVEGAPGKFQLLLDGKALKSTFGTEGADWHWQDGGTVKVLKKTKTIALHDLTGFEGRCDAIFFTTDLDTTPPETIEQIEVLRRIHLGVALAPKDAGEYDLVVVGGGVAGTAAAVSAARLGLTVALIQDRPVLGGNNSSEVRVWLQGSTSHAPYPRIGDVVMEMNQTSKASPGIVSEFDDNKKLGVVEAEKNITLFLNHRGNEVVIDGNDIKAVIAQHTKTGQKIKVRGRWFLDSTGDGCIGALAGADFEITEEGHMGRSNMWRVTDTGEPSEFPVCTWAHNVVGKNYPKDLKQLGVWFWESGFFRHPLEESEMIRDNNFRGMYGVWDALKNMDKRYPNHKLEWAAYIAGKRESRRLLGDVILTKEDIMESRVFDDGCIPTSWTIDLHLPHPDYHQATDKDAFLSKAYYTEYPRPYWVPYRCLYSRNINNLFMAGRDISVTHEALGTVRVMRTTGMMGEIVGMAASICKENDTDPRGVYEDHLKTLKVLMDKGVGNVDLIHSGTAAWRSELGENHALTATLSSSGDSNSTKFPLSRIQDDRIVTLDNNSRWMSNGAKETWVEFSWKEPITIAGSRIASGNYAGNSIVANWVQDFEWRYLDGESWKTVPGTSIEDNQHWDFSQRFEPVTAKRLRLYVTKTPNNITRFWEVELYAP